MTDGRMRLERSLRAAAEIEPAAARAARSVLGTFFDRPCGPDAPWDESPLSRDGYPVELGFVAGVAGVAGVSGLRYTVELPVPADPHSIAETPDADPPNAALRRVARTLGALRRLGVTPPALPAGTGSEPGSPSDPVPDSHFEANLRAEGGETVLALLRRIQRSAPETLRYGAWLSGRHEPGTPGPGATGDRFKLYLEVPPGSEPLWRAWERSLLVTEPPLPTRAVTLRMVGVDLVPVTETVSGTARVELYYDLSSLNPSEISPLAERAGLGERSPEILDLLREAVCLPLRHELPARYDWGFSYALDVAPDGSARPRAFTLYTFANALFGGDGRIRRALLALGRSRGWDLSLYERISRPVAERRGFVTCHGVFGVTVTDDPSRPTVATWGLAPPPVPAVTGATAISGGARAATAAVGGRA